MKKQTLLLLLSFIVVAAGYGETTSAQTELEKITIEHCGDPKVIDDLINAEKRRGLVLDARPFAINQSMGKFSFSGKTGRVSVTNMNPFVYKYNITVGQQELTSSAITDFIDLLLPPGLKPASGKTQSDGKRVAATIDRLAAIEARLDSFDPSQCPHANDNGCVALIAMNDLYVKIKAAMPADFQQITNDLPAGVTTYENDLLKVRKEDATAYETCHAAHRMNADLISFDPATKLDQLRTAGRDLIRVKALASELETMSDNYSSDDDLKKYQVLRCEGFSCVKDFKAYGTAVKNLLGTYEPELTARTTLYKKINAMLDFTEQTKETEGLFARTFEITKRYEMSAATISIARVKIEQTDQGNKPNAEGEGSSGAGTKSPKPAGAGSSSSSGSANGSDDGDGNAAGTGDKPTSEPKSGDKKGDGAVSGSNLASAQVNESITLGRPRFLLSGGLVFSPLARRTFETVKGFSRDGDGNPTGDGTKDVVGFGENSPRRLLPMAILNTRLASFEPTSLYFSFGVTAKHDDNLDIEYLLGPSFSLLNERALFTFGAYAGKTQRLVSDVKLGDEIPDSAGDAKLFVKHYAWKPGFSFSYVFSKTAKTESEAGQSVKAGNGDDLKDEIRIGGIPFNFAMGLAYTSLEDRTYDEIVGFARDRQGNLTNGQNLTRIVGLTSSSNYRLVPMAMLHARLINFGRHSFYFSSGLTGRKTDNNLAIEYLLGGSINLYRRKIFLTTGMFAGKQQELGGNFFTGAKLDKTQSVTIQDRYVWKPAFAISYDLSKILRVGAN
jgi:hypothetical protein